ncbi:hypothetical protein GCM10009851_40080 [Herbiconiux moechotypicola]|uniref:YdhG-like domain-containing protein n=1 Tax=Herbiconiux moechotypicola TaxID=637393 RepID=A0ABP5R850_9MICO
MGEQQYASVDAYIASFPHDVQTVLEGLRCAVMSAVPDAVESVSYHMPTFTFEGRHLLFVAAWKTHVALYAVPGFEGELEAEVAPYRSAKDTVKFPLRKAVPYELVAAIAARIAEQRVGG